MTLVLKRFSHSDEFQLLKDIHAHKQKSGKLFFKYSSALIDESRRNKEPRWNSENCSIFIGICISSISGLREHDIPTCSQYKI